MRIYEWSMLCSCRLWTVKVVPTSCALRYHIIYLRILLWCQKPAGSLFDIHHANAFFFFCFLRCFTYTVVLRGYALWRVSSLKPFANEGNTTSFSIVFLLEANGPASRTFKRMYRGSPYVRASLPEKSKHCIIFNAINYVPF